MVRRGRPPGTGQVQFLAEQASSWQARALAAEAEVERLKGADERATAYANAIKSVADVMLLEKRQ